MGDRGPCPLPQRILDLRGSQLAKASAERAISVRGVAPSPPDDMAGAAIDEWNRVVPHLEAAGLIGEVDLGVLTVYCDAWARYRAATAALAAGGHIWYLAGRHIRSPYYDIMDKERKTIMLTGRRMGLSASDRRGLASSSTGDHVDEIDAWRARHQKA